MTNQALGLSTLVAFALTFIFAVAGSYTEELTSWDMLSSVASWVFIVGSIWGAVRLGRMK